MSDREREEAFEKSLKIAERLSETCEGEELYNVLWALMDFTTDIVMEMEGLREDNQIPAQMLCAKMFNQMLASKKEDYEERISRRIH